ncbi:MAG: hypothetical protein IJT91_01275 [Clostridia bacterium]|nr:hypothetical protein [Clostridia bacterium]
MIKRIMCLILALIALTPVLAGCGKRAGILENADLEFTSGEKTYDISFADSDGSGPVTADADELARFIDVVNGIKPEYMYTELYGVQECYERFFTRPSVEKHEFSALDVNGELTADRLMELAKNNNVAFLGENSTNKHYYTEPGDELFLSICRLVVDTVNEMKSRYPGIDWERVYCNLGRLKIFFKSGMMSFAAVTPDMMLELGEASLHIADILKGGSSPRLIIIHEVMHIIQLGCSCENIEHCRRRAGVTYMWDDVSLQGNDWSWFFEGSAELNMCVLTGEEPVTYENMINYLKDVGLSILLNKNISADHVRTVSFYDDPHMLFDALGAYNKDEVIEAANMLEAIEILQNLPPDFASAYQLRYGTELTDEIRDEIRINIKPALCLTMSRIFYKNLARAAADGGMTENDVYCMIAVLEAAMEHHMLLSNEERKEINSAFKDGYMDMRKAFFGMLEKSGSDASLKDYYAYRIFTDDGHKTVDATLSFLDEDKRSFIIERFDFLKREIGSKIW